MDSKTNIQADKESKEHQPTDQKPALELIISESNSPQDEIQYIPNHNRMDTQKIQFVSKKNPSIIQKTKERNLKEAADSFFNYSNILGKGIRKDRPEGEKQLLSVECFNFENYFKMLTLQNERDPTNQISKTSERKHDSINQ